VLSATHIKHGTIFYYSNATMTGKRLRNSTYIISHQQSIKQK